MLGGEEYKELWVNLLRVKAQPVEPMAPATVEVDLWGDALAAAGELETGWGGESFKTGQMSMNLYNQ